ncbi:beta-lactamase domain protein [Alicyclobacillus acidocaldarius subsp. acidocaldarius Tc-4-1]|uniref:Beta-lactamase domain protein n=1 Tax=Alicyclobacillus acidocaldarius (strain Tc-4-1) TaxID=1048834 RepID=F8II70_ALIAT|nr:metal-dependent hydrolase [Alicyclobacillus acidocaldarius]AEJ44550.1 beta-lactamase domain protein [Alicyclobacillus acidocaldarius subsp. acidocaldarius Tc-4-1]
MKLTYHGQSCFVIESGEHRLVIDPFLSGNPNAVAKPEDIKVQWVVLTHGHSDHVLDAETIARNNNATIIAANELAVYYASKGLNVHPMGIGGKRDFPFGRVKVTLAFHGSGVETENGLVYVGPPVGFLLTLEGKTIYHAGDTGAVWRHEDPRRIEHHRSRAAPHRRQLHHGPGRRAHCRGVAEGEKGHSDALQHVPAHCAGRCEVRRGL